MILESKLAEVLSSPQQRAMWKTNGKYFGYPDCCVDYFVNRTYGQVVNQEILKETEGTGFLPCPKCSARIKAGEIKPSELISGRVHPTPFPIS